MFAFVTISYNQEKYILQHLESIKYQIEQYGEGKEFLYILADDASTDSTVTIAKEWLDNNRFLFSKIIIADTSHNYGIVKNYLRALRLVGDNDFKLLAGDDLYYTNDIFEVFQGSDMVLTPVLPFTDQFERGVIDLGLYAKGASIIDKYSFIKKDIKYRCTIHAPGVFQANELIQDRGWMELLDQFSWIEDYPSWYYWFYVSKKKISVDIQLKPYILYRVSSGISNSSTNGRRREYLEEEAQIKEWIGNKQGLSKWLSPYKYKRYLEKNFFDLLSKNDEYHRVNEEDIISYLKHLDSKVAEYQITSKTK